MKKRTSLKKIFLFATYVVLIGCVLGIQDVKAQDKVITIRFATYLGPSYVELYPAFEKFCQVVNEKSKGRAKVDFYPSETLIKAKELYSGLMMGSVECVDVPMVYWHGNLPISQGLSLPYVWEGDLQRYSDALAPGTPLEKFLNEEFAKSNLFCIFGVCDGREMIWTRNKPVRTPEDIVRMKIRTSGLIPQEVSQKLRANSVNMASGEVYTAVQRGTVDGTYASLMTVESRGLQEQLKYVTLYPTSNFGPMALAFRKNWFDKLPKDIQEIIIEAGKAYRETMIVDTFKVEATRKVTLKKSSEFITLTPEETKSFNDVLLPLYDEWTARPEIGEKGKTLLSLIRATKKSNKE